MKRILLMLLAVFAIGGNLWAKTTNAVWGTPAGNGAWDSENNVYTWTLNYSNLCTIFETPDGSLADYTALHLTTSDNTSEYRVCFMNGSTAVATIAFYSAGQKDLVFAECNDTKDIDLSAITHISFGGASGSGSVTVTNVYLEGPDAPATPLIDSEGNVNIGMLEQQDGNVTTLIPTVENGEYTYTATGTLQFGFKHKNIDVNGYDKLTIAYSTGSGSWCMQPKKGDLGGWTQLPAGQDKTYEVTIPEGTETLGELSLFSSPWSTPSEPITIKSITLHKAQLTSIQQLVDNKFYMVTKNVVMCEFGKTGVDLTTGNPAVITNDASSFCQMQLEPVNVEGTKYWYIHAAKANGDQMYGWWGNSDDRPMNNCVNPSMWWGNFEIAMGAGEGYEANGKLYGGAYELGALFTIEYVEDKGFSFKSNAIEGGNPIPNPYIGADGKQSETPYYWSCYPVTAEWFQNIPVPADYVELPIEDLVATGSATVKGEVIDMTNGGGAKWQYAEPQNWSGYKYLVIAPKRRFVTSAQKDAGADAERTAVNIHVNGKSLQWIGEWNPKRLWVLDLTSTKEGLDLTTVSNKITSVEIRHGNNEQGEWSISAAYLTNTRPTYSESLYDHDAGALGDAETNADHVRTLSVKGTLGVVCLPYASAICGADAFEFVGVNDRENPRAIWVRPVVGLLEAGKPYIFETNTNLNVTFYRAGAHEEATAGSDNGLVGVFADGTVTGNKYVVSGGEFKKGTGTTSIKANRAYLDLDEAPVYATPAEAQARGCINIMGDETAIESIFGTQKSNAIYDLNGRRVENPTRGFYIMGGKKYIVK